MDNNQHLAQQAPNQGYTRGPIDQRAQQQAIHTMSRRYVRPGEMRSIGITFVANGYLVSEADQQHRVFMTAPALIAYLTEVTVGGPGGPVEPVEPEQAGLDLGPVPNRAEEHYTMDDSALTDLSGDTERDYLDTGHLQGCAARSSPTAICSCPVPG